MPRRIPAPIGKRFGRWTVVSNYRECTGKSRWGCVCACGTAREVCAFSLRSGGSQSCGCATREAATTHGEMRGGKKSPEYLAWQHAKERCMNENNSRYEQYGARGITVCTQWLHSFESFLADMGRRPSSKHSLDRIDVNGNYEPGNCRWATASQQNANRRPKRFCVNGHELPTTGKRICRRCHQIRNAAYRARKAKQK